MKRKILIMSCLVALSLNVNSQSQKTSSRSSSTISIDEADGVKKEDYIINRNDSSIFFKIENEQLIFLKINGDKISPTDYKKYLTLVNSIRAENKNTKKESAERAADRITDSHDTYRNVNGQSYHIAYSPNNKGMLTDENQTRYFGEKYEIVMEHNKMVKLYYEGKEIPESEYANHKDACQRVMQNAMNK